MNEMQEYEENQAPVSPEPSNAARWQARLALMRMLAQLDPRAKQCAELSSEEEIIECMAKRYPTLFIT
jgi:hypothetical protein